MNFIKVILWGDEIGRLAWDHRKNIAYFIYNAAIIDRIPDIAPLISPKALRKALRPVYGDSRGIYHNLPPFLADSLPDYWGSLLFSKWIEDKKIPRSNITPLHRLTFMGKRGMGAFEFEPAEEEFNKPGFIDIKALYDLSVKIFEERYNSTVPEGEDITMHSLLQVGTSAGGRQKKAIIAINRETGEIRSGQIAGLEGYDYFILKFGDEKIPISEIEMSYFRMATDADITMEESRLLPLDGVNHFLTHRFDRKNGKKIMMQTLAAINPDALNYEDLFDTCRFLKLTETELTQLYRRLVFNVLANNTDDHIKNFSFLLEEGERWKLSPAYDLTFIFNATGTAPNDQHVFSVGGKLTRITKEDLIEFAKNNDIRNPQKIIDEVAQAVGKFPEYAEKYGVWQPYRSMIKRRIEDNLRAFGYLDSGRARRILTDSTDRKIVDFNVSINSKGMYVLRAVINGHPRRRFIRPDTEEFKALGRMDIYNLSDAEILQLVETHF